MQRCVEVELDLDRPIRGIGSRYRRAGDERVSGLRGTFAAIERAACRAGIPPAVLELRGSIKGVHLDVERLGLSLGVGHAKEDLPFAVRRGRRGASVTRIQGSYLHEEGNRVIATSREWLPYVDVLNSQLALGRVRRNIPGTARTRDSNVRQRTGTFARLGTAKTKLAAMSAFADIVHRSDVIEDVADWRDGVDVLQVIRCDLGEESLRAAGGSAINSIAGDRRTAVVWF